MEELKVSRVALVSSVPTPTANVSIILLDENEVVDSLKNKRVPADVALVPSGVEGQIVGYDVNGKPIATQAIRAGAFAIFKGF